MGGMEGVEPQSSEETGDTKHITAIKFQDNDGKWHYAIEVISPQLVYQEGFVQTDLDDGVYTAAGTYQNSTMGFGITNNNLTNSLTVEIGTKTVLVPAGKSFYDFFNKPTTVAVTVTGSSLNFNAIMDG